jgi:hypothetical protein
MRAICGAPVGAPSPKVAATVWTLAAPDPGALEVRLAGLTTDEQADLQTTLQQAWAVTVATALTCGQDRQAFTANRFFGALARVWSPSYRAALNRDARNVFEMRADTIKIHAWPEVFHQGIRPASLWSEATKGLVVGVFRATLQRPQRPGRGARHRVYRIRLVDGPRRRELEQLLGVVHRSRLLLAVDSAPPAAIERTVVAEQAYDVMMVGDGAHDIRQRLEASRLWLDVRAVRGDVKREHAAILNHRWKQAYGEWKKSPEVERARSISDPAGRRDHVKRLYLAWLQADDQAALRLRNHYRTRRGRYQAARAVLREVRRRQRARDTSEGDRYIEIKSTFSVGVNRRWYARNIWVPETRSKDVLAIHDAGDEGRLYATSQRGRWFRAQVPRRDEMNAITTGEYDLVPLYGVDVSSSMDHVIAVVTGHRDDEERIVEGEETPKAARARRLWEASKRGDVNLVGFGGPDDARLRACISELQNARYGADVDSLARLLASDPAQYSRGLGDAANIRRALAVIAEPYDEIWLRVCRALAAAAINRDGCLRVVDPLDGTEFIWNPPRVAKHIISHRAFKLLVGAPRGLRDRKLENRVSPGLVHMMDAAYAAEVVRALNERDVRDVAIVFDCFLIPQSGSLLETDMLLEDAMRAAGRPWFERLEPVYMLFLHYLSEHIEYGSIVQGWYDTWKRRRGRKDWPVFRFKTETTYGEADEEADSV